MKHLFNSTGEPSPPINLILSGAPQGLGVLLSWTPGSALQGEEVTFVIVSEELATGNVTETATNITSVMLQPASSQLTCPQFNFTVYSVNGFGRSSSGASAVTLLPTGMSRSKPLITLPVSNYVHYSSTFFGKQKHKYHCVRSRSISNSIIPCKCIVE